MSKRVYSVTGHESEKGFTRTTSTMNYHFAAVLTIGGKDIGTVSFSASGDGARKSGLSWLKNCGPEYGIRIASVKLIKGVE